MKFQTLMNKFYKDFEKKSSLTKIVKNYMRMCVILSWVLITTYALFLYLDQKFWYMSLFTNIFLIGAFFVVVPLLTIYIFLRRHKKSIDRAPRTIYQTFEKMLDTAEYDDLDTVPMLNEFETTIQNKRDYLISISSADQLYRLFFFALSIIVDLFLPTLSEYLGSNVDLFFIAVGLLQAFIIFYIVKYFIEMYFFKKDILAVNYDMLLLAIRERKMELSEKKKK